MPPIKDIGLDDDLNEQIKYNKRHGGVSDALRRKMRRPDGENWRMKAFYNADDQEAYRLGWRRIFNHTKKK